MDSGRKSISGQTVVNPLNPFNEQEELSAPEKELISTETSYCDQLCTLIEVYADPLKMWVENLESDVKARQRPDYQIELVREELQEKHATLDDALFSNVRQLLDCSRELLSALEVASQSGSKSIVMDTFRRHAPFLTMYSSYTSNFSRANSLLQRLQLDPRFLSFIKCAELQPRCKGLTLPSFLILPVQRVPRYGLLIKEAIKMCSDETGAKLLMATHELTNSVTKRIDSKIEEEERRNKLIDVQHMLGIELLAPAREFIRDGMLTKICHSGRKEFYFVLCTDRLIYATDSGGFLRSGQKYSVNKNYCLQDLLIVVPDDDRDVNKSFFVCSKDKAFEVEASTKDIANLWVDDIIRLKQRRTLQHTNAEKPWYSSGERTSGFSLYAMEKNSVVVNTYRVHSSADLSCGVISFSEVVPIVVDDEPSGVHRPPSTGYKRFDSFNNNQASPEPPMRYSESRVTEGERRSSFTLMLQHALGRRSASMSDDNKSRLGQEVSEPVSIVNYPSKESVEIGEYLADSMPKNKGNTADLESDDDSPPASSGPAPPLGQIGRMNTADLRLFGASASNLDNNGPDSPSSSRKSKELKPAAPFLPLSKAPADPSAFTPTIAAPRPDMPKSMPPPVPEPATGSNNGSSLSAKGSSSSKTEKVPEKAKSSPLIRPPPPPAVKRAGSGSSHTPAAANARAATAATRVVKAASVKAKRSTGGKNSPRSHLRKNSEDSADKSTSRKSNSGTTGTGLKGSHGEGPARPHLPPPAPPLKHHSSDPSAPPMEAVIGVAVKAASVPPPLLSERPKHGSCDWSIVDCKAMAEAVADIRIDGLGDDHSRPHRTATSVNRSRSGSGDVATGNVKCALCDSILAYKIGTEPDAVVNQHIAQVHGLD